MYAIRSYYDNGLVSGSAYVFVKPQGGWSSKTEDAKLTASDANSFERVGYSVAVSGDTVVVERDAPGRLAGRRFEGVELLVV